MSAQLATSNSFSAHLALAAGVAVTITASTLADLQAVVGKLAEPANDAGKAPAPAAPAAKAPAGAHATPTTAPSAPPAAAAGDAGNAPASTSTQASAPPAASGSAGDQGNAAAASPSPAPAAASPASSSAPAASPAVTFDELKKAFLALSTKADGRTKCENVLKPFGIPKLSEAKPEQYAAVLAEIQKASA